MLAEKLEPNGHCLAKSPTESRQPKGPPAQCHVDNVVDEQPPPGPTVLLRAAGRFHQAEEADQDAAHPGGFHRRVGGPQDRVPRGETRFRVRQTEIQSIQ